MRWIVDSVISSWNREFPDNKCCYVNIKLKPVQQNALYHKSDVSDAPNLNS